MRGDRREHTNAVITALEAAGLTVDDGERTSDPPVVLVQRNDIIDGSETLDEISKEFDGIYQLTCVHVSREGTESLEGRALDAAKNVTVAGRHILKVEPTPSMGARRDLDANDQPWFAPCQVRIWTTPA